MLGDYIALVSFVGHPEPVFLPRTIKQGDNPMMKQIEEVPQGRVPGPDSLGHQQTVGVREHPFRACQAYEVHRHPCRGIRAELEALDLARRERGIWIGDEPSNLLLRVA